MATGNDADAEGGSGALAEFETRTGRTLALLGALVGVVGILLVLVGGTAPAGGSPQVTQTESYLIAGGVALVVTGTVLTYLTRWANL